MKKASMKLFDLVYGELLPLESRIFGKMCFIFYDDNEENPRPQIVYYPSTKEVKTLRDKEKDFSSFIPLYMEGFKDQFSNWMETKYSKEILFKGVDYLEFLEELLC
jgi:hypothetical protein